MSDANKTMLNFAGGEVSPDLTCRTDLPVHDKVLARMRNWISDPKGKAVFRTGTQYVYHTKGHQQATFIEFQFSDIQAYMIEVTDLYFRFYKDGALIINSTPLNTITGISNASPGVVSYSGGDLNDGEEIFIDGVVGMPEINGRYFTAQATDDIANTFELNDEFGNPISTEAYGVYVSGGSVSDIYQIQTPYRVEDIEDIKYSQNADTMYITHRNYAPRRLTRTAHDNWTLVRYTRTADPIEGNLTTYVTPTAITAANPAVVTKAAHGLKDGQRVYATAIGGMVELNNRHFIVNFLSTSTFNLTDADTGILVDSTLYTAFTSAGFFETIGDSSNPTTLGTTTANHYPGAASFTDDARLMLSGSNLNPETMWFSRGPSAAGAVRFDDYTTGTTDSNGVIFTLAPLKGLVDSILWTSNTDKYIAIGTFGSIRRVFGAAESQPVTPTAITAKSANSDGVNGARPVLDGSTLFYIRRNGQSLESIEYDYTIDGYSPDDKNLITDNLSAPGLKMVVRQIGRPTVIWVLRDDGVLLGLTYKGRENLAGWHVHTLAGGFVEWIGRMPRDNQQDQLWLIVRRTVNGNTVRHIEFLSDSVVLPDRDDFNGITDTKAGDAEAFYAYQWEVRKQAKHMDACLSYDGSIYGSSVGATLLPETGANVVGTLNVVFEASVAVFSASMIGREIWGAYDALAGGGGRAVITGFTNSTHVTATITAAFPLTLFAAGAWYLTATTIQNAFHLEGATVGIVADGSPETDDIVFDGAITLADPASVIHIGLKYVGLLKTLPLDVGGVTGSAINKLRSITEVVLRLRNCGDSVKIGTDYYAMTKLDIRTLPLIADRVPPLTTDLHRQTIQDSRLRDKVLYIQQDQPMPATVLGIDVYLSTTDE